MSRYSVNPLEESFHKWDREQRERRNQYWQAIYAMRSDYISDNSEYFDKGSKPTLDYYAQLKYGLKMGVDTQGNYTKDYTVTDPKKFMLFQLKYMK
jgi:hypothetical protein